MWFGYGSQNNRVQVHEVGEIVASEHKEIDGDHAADVVPRVLMVNLVLLEVISHTLSHGIVQRTLGGVSVIVMLETPNTSKHARQT